MYHKVFINHIEIAFSETPLSGYFKAPGFKSVDEFYAFVEEISAQQKINKIAFIDAEGAFWSAFANGHKPIEAAGGLVTNAKNELLVIERLGKWDLPKGKCEKGESPAETAVREVAEECGISQLKIIQKLPDTFHTYLLNNNRVLKRTFWFEMSYVGAEKLIPQTEEDISQVLFMPKVEVRETAMKNTYASLMPLFEAYLIGHK